MVSIAITAAELDSWQTSKESALQRFFSIAIILNWLAAIPLLIGMVGFGMSPEAKGLMAASANDRAAIKPAFICQTVSFSHILVWARYRFNHRRFVGAHGHVVC
jgi:hypothetical protein